MKRNILSALLIMLGIAYSNAQPGFESFSMNNQLVKDLSGYNWKMKMMRPGEGEKQGIHKIFPEDIETLVWNPAKVPGDVYTDLWKAGAIDDPYFGRNSVKAQWVQRELSIDESHNDVTVLRLQGLVYNQQVAIINTTVLH